MIPYGRQSVTDEDVQAVIEVLRSDFLTQGPCVERFENAVSAYCGAEHAVAVANGTAALHVSCLALGLGPGSLLWTSPITFVASANCARYVGADVDFVDIDPSTYNMSPDALAQKLEQAATRGSQLPDVVVPVHFGGASCDVAAIRALSDRYGFKVLEDASHAIGGRLRGTPVGACDYSDGAVFSFHPVKIITTGEGGMLVTNDSVVAERARLLRQHGITRDESMMRGPSEGPWYYEQIDLGFNYRLTDIQSALGFTQMARTDQLVERRNQIAARYLAAFADVPVRCQQVDDDVLSAYHLFVIELEDADRSEVFSKLRSAGIGVNVHYIPVHMQPYYRELGFSAGDFPNAEAYYRRAITLPLYPAMTDEQQERVIDCVREALSSS